MTILRAFGIDGLLAEDERRSHDHLQIDRTRQFLGLQVVVPRGLAGGEEILRQHPVLGQTLRLVPQHRDPVDRGVEGFELNHCVSILPS